MDRTEKDRSSGVTVQPIRPLSLPLPAEQLFEKRELFGKAGEQVVRKLEYRLDAAREVPDFSPFITWWDQSHNKGYLPTFSDFERLIDHDQMAAIHLVEASSIDPGRFRFLKFDSIVRRDQPDLSGQHLSDYPDPLVRESSNQDYAAAAFGRRGTIMDIMVKTNGDARRFARLILPIAARPNETRASQLISIVRLLEFTDHSILPIDQSGLISEPLSSGRLYSLAAGQVRPTRDTARQVLMKHFHNGNQELLADQELLELLLRESDTVDESRELAELLIQEFGGLAAVLAVGNERLIHVPGMTPQALVRLKVVREMASRIVRLGMVDKPVFAGTGVVLDYCRARMAHETTEHVRIIYLDQKNRLIADEPIHGGGVSSVPVSPRNIVKRAVVLDAQSIVIAHNHPSGDPSPSGADVDVTRDLKKAAQAVGIRLLDHLIIGRSGHVSLQSLGHLDD